MPDKIVIRIDNNLVIYDQLENVPLEFDHLIAYEPEIPRPPHTKEQHDRMHDFNKILHELLRREKK